MIHFVCAGVTHQPDTLAAHIVDNRYLNRQDSDFVDIVLADLNDYLEDATPDR
jgi:hypothetical protein